MDISPDIIKDYLREKFNDYTETNSEFIVNSLFCEDYKRHMSINSETGLWQCFKSKEKGNFLHLVSAVEGISYGEASVLLQRKLFNTPEKLFQVTKSLRDKQESISKGKTIQDEIKNFKRLSKASVVSDLLTERLAYKFALSRKINPNKLYVGIKGKYVNRVIIPFEDSKGMFYFQARQLTGFGMKYLNPSFAEYGVKASEILYPFDREESYILVSEGPIDALSLQNIGINATSTQGSVFSKSHLKELSGKKIILAYDNDEAGDNGINYARRLIRSKNLPTPYIVRPPKQFKDWNDFVVEATSTEVKAWIAKTVTKMDFDYNLTELLD
jgi:DNA primase